MKCVIYYLEELQLNSKELQVRNDLLFASYFIFYFPKDASDFELLVESFSYYTFRYGGVHVEGREDIRLSTVNDRISLEYNDWILLRFINNPILLSDIENVGEYIRDTATVNIIDDDCKLAQNKCRNPNIQSLHGIITCQTKRGFCTLLINVRQNCKRFTMILTKREIPLFINYDVVQFNNILLYLDLPSEYI